MQKGTFLPLIVIIALATSILGITIYLKQNNKPPAFNLPANQLAPQSSPSPTPDETANPDLIGANWKTYKDDTYKFELAIPKNWYMWATSGSKEKKLYPGDTFITQSFDPKEKGTYDQQGMKSSDKVKNPMRIDILIDTGNKNSLEDIKNDLIKNNGPSYGGESIFYNLENVTETKLVSQPALSATYKNKSIKQLYLLNEKNYLYGIDIYFDPTSENNKLLDQILSTFKFTQ